MKKIKFGLFVILFLILGSFLFWDMSQKGITDEKKLVDYPYLTTYWGTLAPSANMWSWLASPDYATMRTSMGVSPTAGSSSIVTVGALTAGSLATGFTPVTVPLGGTGASTYALNGVLFGNAANAIGVTAIGTEGQVLRVGASPFVPAWSSTLNVATLDMTSSTSSIPWVMGTAAFPITEGQAYFNTTSHILGIGSGSGVGYVVMTPTSASSANQLAKFSVANSSHVENSTVTEDGIDVNLQALNLITTGAIYGRVPVQTALTASTTLTTSMVKGQVYHINTTDTIVLTIGTNVTQNGVGSIFCVKGLKAGSMRITPVATEAINNAGTVLTTASSLQSGAAAGDYACFMAITDTAAGVAGWETWGYKGTWSGL